MPKPTRIQPFVLRSVAMLAILSGNLAFAQTNWDGYYAGLTATSSRNTVSGTTVKSDGTFGTNAANEAANYQNNATGLGGHFGRRYQLSSGLVAGYEIDMAWLDDRSRSSDLISAGTYAGQPASSNQYETTWIATARLIAGWPVDKVLIYGTAGTAYASAKAQRTQYKGNAGTGLTEAMFTETDQITRVGTAIGAGADWRIAERLSLRAEYLQVRFPDATVLFPDARGGAQGSYTNVQGRIANSNVQTNSIRIGLTYLFNGL